MLKASTRTMAVSQAGHWEVPGHMVVSVRGGMFSICSTLESVLINEKYKFSEIKCQKTIFLRSGWWMQRAKALFWVSRELCVRIIYFQRFCSLLANFVIFAQLVHFCILFVQYHTFTRHFLRFQPGRNIWGHSILGNKNNLHCHFFNLRFQTFCAISVLEFWEEEKR